MSAQAPLAPAPDRPIPVHPPHPGKPRVVQNSLRARLNRLLLARWVQPGLVLMCLVPLGWLLFAAFTDRLGANPAEALIRASGDWALRFLCLTLAVTPARIGLQLPTLARLRRTLGLFVAFYALCHLLAYAWFDMGFEVDEIARDIAKRPFILVGMVAFGLLLPLAATSFNRAVKALGAVRWRILHKAVFGIAVLALLHFYWMRSAKNDVAEVVVYALVLGFFMGWRVRHAWQDRPGREERDAKPAQPAKPAEGQAAA